MDKRALSHVLYGSIYELAKDEKYYYHSAFGGKYSKFTEEGEKVLLETLTLLVEKILDEEARLDEQRAKDLVLKGLKGEKT